MTGPHSTKPNSYIIHTYGCQMNKHDSEHIAGVLEECGYTRAASDDEAELVILNTCSVRKSAEQKVWGKLGTFADQVSGTKTIAVAGCMAQVQGTDIMKTSPVVSLVFGLGSMGRLPELIEESRKGPVCDLGDITKAEIDLLPRVPENSFTAWVPVSHGCDNNCSYCIVPRARGSARSRQLDDILREVEQLTGLGVIEIVLLGQNVNSYGRDLAAGNSFARLLEEVSRVPGVERVKFETSHPADMNENIIEAMAENDKVCEYLHLPAQSGSNRILEAMNRGYKREYYIEKAASARDRIENLTLSTDIIVGFPGETDDDLLETRKLLEEVRFDNAFIFKYSKREGTAAAGTTEEVPEAVKTERFLCLSEVQDMITADSLAGLKGKTMEVLVESRAARGDFMKGRTRGNQVVLVSSSAGILPGTLAWVKINGAGRHTARGEVVEIIERLRSETGDGRNGMDK